MATDGNCGGPVTDDLQALSLAERISFFYCSSVQDFAGVSTKPAEYLISPDDVPYFLELLESPDRDQWLQAEAVLIPYAQGKCTPDGTQSRLLVHLDMARAHNEVLTHAGALPIFTAHLIRVMQGLRSINFQYVDIDIVERALSQLNRAITLLYLVVTLTPMSGAFQRALLDIGLFPPRQFLTDLFDCLQHHHNVPGFPVKRLVLLLYVWLSSVVGDLNDLAALKDARRRHHNLPSDDATRLVAKSLKKPIPMPLGDPTDALYPVRFKAQAARDAIYTKYIHKPHYELAPIALSDDLRSDDQDWVVRVEQLYKQVLLPKYKEYTALLSTIVAMASGSVMDKRNFFSKRSFSLNEEPSSGQLSTEEQLYWTWMNREKAIVLDVTALVVLLLLKQTRASHLYKGELLAQGLVDAAILPAVTVLYAPVFSFVTQHGQKFLNRDTATYVQLRQTDESASLRVDMPVPMKRSVPAEDDVEYALAPTRIVTTLLRVVQRLTKRKPSLIRPWLCRAQSLVWLKRVLNLREPKSRLYALKLVKSQGRYLGHQWMRKFTCVHLLTEIYMYVRPELEDDWLRSDEDESNPLAKSNETWLNGEVQSFHHKYYWSTLKSTTPAASSAVSVAVQGMLDLAQDALDLDGGSCRKLAADLKLDAALCAQYEKWLDAQGLVGSSDKASLPLPISFN
ncbi:Aste57867_3978 [Aphanomyces stellatus]|uniref:Aste57867_3978 protein n=1 Tax=Aphanomyces stellatus TaxID=120398 RepID=A0A485KAR0_9STRA|nr:hypothetical protein As57867_003967 [Aphanomyces stellatus]VFT81115.1 Aste57867_3978 [Aphanomyces stellatus]